jgi:hypothetical protein
MLVAVAAGDSALAPRQADYQACTEDPAPPILRVRDIVVVGGPHASPGDPSGTEGGWIDQERLSPGGRDLHMRHGHRLADTANNDGGRDHLSVSHQRGKQLPGETIGE